MWVANEMKPRGVKNLSLTLILFFFTGFDRHWLQWQGCGCAMISMALMAVVVVFWWLNEILFYCSVYIILLC